MTISQTEINQRIIMPVSQLPDRFELTKQLQAQLHGANLYGSTKALERVFQDDINLRGLQNPEDIAQYLNESPQGKLVAAVIGMEAGLERMIEERLVMENLEQQRMRELITKYLILEAALKAIEQKAHAADVNNAHSDEAISKIKLAAKKEALKIEQAPIKAQLAKDFALLINTGKLNEYRNLSNYNHALSNRLDALANQSQAVNNILQPHQQTMQNAQAALKQLRQAPNDKAVQQALAEYRQSLSSQRHHMLHQIAEMQNNPESLDPEQYAALKNAAGIMQKFIIASTSETQLQALNGQLAKVDNYQDFEEQYINQLTALGIEEPELQPERLEKLEQEVAEIQAKIDDLSKPKWFMRKATREKMLNEAQAELADKQADLTVLQPPELTIIAGHKQIMRELFKRRDKATDETEKAKAQSLIDEYKQQLSEEYGPRVLLDGDGNLLDDQLDLESARFSMPKSCHVEKADDVIYFLNKGQTFLHDENGQPLLDEHKRPYVIDEAQQDKKKVLEIDGQTYLVDKKISKDDLRTNPKLRQQALKEAKKALQTSELAAQRAHKYATDPSDVLKKGLENARARCNQQQQQVLQEARKLGLYELQVEKQRTATLELEPKPTPEQSKAENQQVPVLKLQSPTPKGQLQEILDKYLTGNTPLSPDELKIASVQLQKTVAELPVPVQRNISEMVMRAQELTYTANRADGHASSIDQQAKLLKQTVVSAQQELEKYEQLELRANPNLEMTMAPKPRPIIDPPRPV